jgi:hypothetical protein
LLVTVEGNGRAVPEFRPLDVFRWETVAVDAAAAESAADVLELARAALSEARDGADGRTLAARLVISCSEPVSRCLASDPEQFRADLRGQAGGDVWIEKIKLAPLPSTQPPEPTLSEDATAELRAVFAELRGQPDNIRALFAGGDCGKLVNRLPAELRAAFEKSWDEVFTRASVLLQGGASEPTQ